MSFSALHQNEDPAEGSTVLKERLLSFADHGEIVEVRGEVTPEGHPDGGRTWVVYVVWEPRERPIGGRRFAFASLQPSEGFDCDEDADDDYKAKVYPALAAFAREMRARAEGGS